MCMEQMVPELCRNSMCPAHSRCTLKLAGNWGLRRYVSLSIEPPVPNTC